MPSTRENLGSIPSTAQHTEKKEKEHLEAEAVLGLGPTEVDPGKIVYASCPGEWEQDTGEWGLEQDGCLLWAGLDSEREFKGRCRHIISARGEGSLCCREGTEGLWVRKEGGGIPHSPLQREKRQTM